MTKHQPDWNDLRTQMPVTREWAYFDHAAVAPLPAPTQYAFAEWAESMAQFGSVNWGRWRKRVEHVRRLAAQLINAQNDEIALIRNTTEGVNLIAEGIRWKNGENVVIPAGEFPTNLYPWLNLADRGVEVRQVPTDNGHINLQRLEDACDAHTRLIAASWVGYVTGGRVDLAQLSDLAQRKGVLLFVDAIQALGMFPLDVATTKIDFLAADGHKWLLGPEGAGVLYIRRDQLKELRPLGVGWNSVQAAGNFAESEMQLKTTAARYEGGSYNMPGIHAFGASLELLAQIGTPAIGQRLLQLNHSICDQLESAGAVIVSSRDGDSASGIIACDIPGRDPAKLKQQCLDQQVAVNCRGGHLRISPHAYTNDADIHQLLKALTS